MRSSEKGTRAPRSPRRSHFAIRAPAPRNAFRTAISSPTPWLIQCASSRRGIRTHRPKRITGNSFRANISKSFDRPIPSNRAASFGLSSRDSCRGGTSASGRSPGTRARLVPGPSASPPNMELRLVGLRLIIPTPVPSSAVVPLQGAPFRCDAGSDGRLGVVDYRVGPTSAPDYRSRFAIDLSDLPGAG